MTVVPPVCRQRMPLTAWFACRVAIAALLLLVLISAEAAARAEDGSAAWCYMRGFPARMASYRAALPHTLVILGSEPAIQSAAGELEQGFFGMCDAQLAPGKYRRTVGYSDYARGASTYSLLLNGRQIAH